MRRLVVYYCIPKGSENAIDGQALAKAAGVKDFTTIPATIALLRDKGYPIAWNGSGYYIPATEEEAENYVRGHAHDIH